MAESKLNIFRGEFQKNCENFSKVILGDCEVLEASLRNRNLIERMVTDNIVLQADVVLASYESGDAGRHWKTRRGGNWGYMDALQLRVANNIFPRVAEHLNAQTGVFGIFVENFRTHLHALADGAEVITKRLVIADDFHLDITGSLETFLQGSLDALQDVVAAEEGRIVSLLETFVDDKVEEKISQARSLVAGIWGKGTTVNQNAEVRAFYKEVRGILREALADHVTSRFKEFSVHLISEAEALPQRALTEVNVQIERASADIRSAAETAIAGQKEAFDRMAEALISNVSAARGDVASLLEIDEKSLC